VRTLESPGRLLTRYTGIDLEKIEEERTALPAEIRATRHA
jgi:hypothetical protein